jgi:hypothetical protein
MRDLYLIPMFTLQNMGDVLAFRMEVESYARVS